MYCSVWVCDYYVSVFDERFLALTAVIMYVLLALLKG